MNTLLFQLVLVVMWNTMERLLIHANVIGACVYRDVVLFAVSCVALVAITARRKGGRR